MSDFKSQKRLSVVCGIIAAAWAVLSVAFPMEFFSIFFASRTGSNLLLCLMAFVIAVPLTLCASLALKRDIKLYFTVPLNIICQVSFIYLYSIYEFRYNKPYVMLLIVTAHLLLTAVIYNRAKPVAKSRPKDSKGKAKKKNGSKSGSTAPDLLTSITAAAMTTAVAYSLYTLIFNIMVRVFVE